MDVIIVCHTEFGKVYDKIVVAEKSAVSGVSAGVSNLIKLADKYSAKISFAVCPEVIPYFPKNINHEIGIHIHPGWQEFEIKKHKFFVGDKWLKENCKQSSNSTVLKDFSYSEQSDMIKKGKEYLTAELGTKPKFFVAGRWSLNNDTIKALVASGFTHDCSAPSHSISDHYNWSKLPRICMPYKPNEKDYQEKGNMPFLIVPISQTLLGGTVNPEGVITYGLGWLKSCFSEYYKQNVPLFHICLHSPSMADNFYISIMDKFLSFISERGSVNFKFVSEIKEYPRKKFRANVAPYFLGANGDLAKTFLKRITHVRDK